MTGSAAIDCSKQLFTDVQVRRIVKRALGEESYQLVRCDVKRAADGLTGFLGEHCRATLHVRVGTGAGVDATIKLFVKMLPRNNKNKASFIDEGNYFRREMLTYQVFEDVGGDDGPTPWRSKAYIYDESILVMPDQLSLGYSQRHALETLDLPHVLTTAASLARFHAAFANLATSKSRLTTRPYNFLDEHGTLMKDPSFCDSPWLRTCGKLSANLLDTFSKKYNKRNIPDLEDKLTKLYIEACDTLRDYEDDLNVILHKDLWTNNILFKYKDGATVNALLIDFQCVRYGPPAFDLNIFLYLTTSRSFREQNEMEVFKRYYTVFTECLDDATKVRLKGLGYTFDRFSRWCEKSRMFSAFEAIAIAPYVLMSPGEAARHFDDPATYVRYNFEDRTEPVLEHCHKCCEYRDRQIELTEEFVERYILK